MLLQPALARENPTLSRQGINPDPDAMHTFCASSLGIDPLGAVRTAPATFADEFWIQGELWVGAEFDPGNGVDVQVSSHSDFSPIENWNVPFEVAYADTGEGFVPHTPLGIRVRQQSRGIADADSEGRVLIRYLVTNVSGEWQTSGWDLTNVYLGMYADIDLGRNLSEGQPYWNDDQAAFASTQYGDIGFMWDQNSGEESEDDVAARVGVLLPKDEVHAFRIASIGDFSSESVKYGLLRGNSHESQTIDPPTTTPSDYRIVLSAGPFQIPRGETRELFVVFICDDALGTREAVRASGSGPIRTLFAHPEDMVFRSLAPGAQISIYSVTGRLLADLHASGAEARWIAAPQVGAAPGGIYFYRVMAPGEDAQTGRIILLR